MYRARVFLTSFLALPFVLFAQSSFATVYFVVHDPVSHSIAMAYSSSGGNFWQTRVKGKGLIGAQRYGLCPQATPKVFLDQGYNAKEIGEKLYQQCHSVGYEKYRLVAVTTDGTLTSVIAAEGCPAEINECGKIIDTDFVITGGGLENDVLKNTHKAWLERSPEQSLPCQMFVTLKKLYAAGGEKNDFAGASITVDDPNLPNLLHWEARGAEATLLGQLATGMKASHFECE